MRVFHASSSVVDRPDVVHSRDNLDFGRGFYVTTIRSQAVSYAQRFVRRGRRAFLNEYEFDSAALGALRTERFGAYDERWLDFVLSCRRGEDAAEWDVVIGGIANDRVFTTIDLYFAGEIGKDAALGRLAFEKPNDQICLRTQTAIDTLLKFVAAEEIL